MTKSTPPAATWLTPDIPGDIPGVIARDIPGDSAGRSTPGNDRQPYRGWAPVGRARFDAAACAGDRRLRQWDFFTVLNARCALNVTLADIRFASLCQVDVIEWSSGRTWQATTIRPGGRRRIDFGRTPQEGARCAPGRTTLDWLPLDDEHRARVVIDLPRTLFSAGAHGTLTLARPAGAPYLAHVMPLDAGDAFFYQCKIPGYQVDGEVVVGKERFSFGPESRAIRDWGRGLWPARLRWLWGAGHGSTADGRELWANFGGGFGDTSAASENLLVLDGVAHKLGDLDWTLDADGAPVGISDPGGRLILTLAHDFVQKPQLNAGFKSMRLRKAYGHWRGTFREQPGAPAIAVTLHGFGEEMRLKW